MVPGKKYSYHIHLQTGDRFMVFCAPFKTYYCSVLLSMIDNQWPYTFRPRYLALCVHVCDLFTPLLSVDNHCRAALLSGSYSSRGKIRAACLLLKFHNAISEKYNLFAFSRENLFQKTRYGELSGAPPFLAGETGYLRWGRGEEGDTKAEVWKSARNGCA